MILNVDSLVIVCPSWIGDTVMATPVLRAARQSLPRATITAVVRPGLDEILNGLPWIDHVVVCRMKGVWGAGRLARAIRHAKPQAALLLPNSFRSALGAWLARVPTRVGYHRDGRGWLLTEAIPRPEKGGPIPAVEYYANLAELAFGNDSIDRTVELAITDAEKSAADEVLQDVDEPFVVLNPGANRSDKRWPAERFAAVADALADEVSIRVVISGSPAESELRRAICHIARTSIVDLGNRQLTLGALKAVIARSKLLITNDTGPRHIAAAFGTPVVTLFGPTDHRWTTINCPHERILVADPFLPGDFTADQHAARCAISQIPIADVILAAKQLLESQRTHSNTQR